MNIPHTCRNCGYSYEIVFDEDYDLPECIDEDEDILEPEYCPFCGTHKEHDE